MAIGDNMYTSFGSTLDLDTVRHKGGMDGSSSPMPEGWSYKGPSRAMLGLRAREYGARIPWRSLALLAMLGGGLYLGGSVVWWTVQHPIRAWALRTGVRVLWTLV